MKLCKFDKKISLEEINGMFGMAVGSIKFDSKTTLYLKLLVDALENSRIHRDFIGSTTILMISKLALSSLVLFSVFPF